jgi:surfeit locus 1 family protein
MKSYRFKPQWVPTLFCLALFILLVSLGRWQWSRAVYKSELELRYQASMENRALTLADAMAIPEEVQGLPIHLAGEFDNARSFLLDNQMEGSRPGYQILTPLLTEEGVMVLVSRGWIAATADRRQPVLMDTRHGTLTLIGKIYVPGNKQVVLKADDFTLPQWPMLIQKLDMSAIAAVLKRERPGVELAPFVIRLNPDQDVEQGEELPRTWQWMTMGPEKHRGYAVQWFGMALALLILYIVFSTEKKLPHE